MMGGEFNSAGCLEDVPSGNNYGKYEKLKKIGDSVYQHESLKRHSIP
jgi:hypothetical protein